MTREGVCVMGEKMMRWSGCVRRSCGCVKCVDKVDNWCKGVVGLSGFAMVVVIKGS